MKKLAMLFVAFFAVCAFAGDLYPTKKELISDIGTHSAPKDTTWVSYATGTSGYIWNPITKERATYYDVGDFDTVSYPINISAVTVYLDEEDAGYTFNYRIYAKDGSTILWESDPVVSVAGYNDAYLETPMMTQDDFWVSLVPDASGYPKVFTGVELGTDPALTHSYLKSNDGIWNPFTDGTDYYEIFSDVQLITYEGVDTLAPILREISGTEIFMNRDMDLSIVVHEQNTVVSPMTAQYNVGAGWIDFNMTQATKEIYTFTGTIPGQAGGTSGLVKFYLEDDLGNAEWSAEYPILWSMDLPVFSEGFDGDVFPPDGWSLQTVGAGWTRGDLADGGFVYEGTYSAVHWDDSGTQDDWMITPAMDIPSEGAYTFSFMQNGFWTYYYGMSEVCVSTDMTNWTKVYEPPYEANNAELELLYDGTWLPVKFSLGAWSGQTVYVGFHYQGDFNHQWYIDNVEVLYDYEGPEIVDIAGNPALSPIIGGYLDNDMVLTLDLSDRSGVKSVVGHYDIGGMTGDAVFSASKDVEETWVGVIPSQAAAATGTINFTLTDIGDLVTNTTDYEIEFVEDTGVAVVKHLLGNETFVGSDMTLELGFYEESPIQSVTGFYSKDGFVNTYEFNLSPVAETKINEYAYTGTIPAENEVVFFNGQVYFKILDTAGNELTTEMFSAKWLAGEIAIFEDFESGLDNWTVNGRWGIEEGTAISGTKALTESVNSNYGNNNTSYAMWATPMDWTTIISGSISFWVKYDLEAGFDYMYFEVSDDGGYNWIRLQTWNGVGVDWNKIQLPMDAVAGISQVTFRFLFRSDQGLDYNGMYIDDLELKTYTEDYGAPTIIADPYAPEYFEGVSGDYTDQIQVRDYSGVASVKCYYTVEGVEGEQSADAVNTTEDWYEFTIPAQEDGRMITYRIWAQDSSPQINADYSANSYQYISGTHLVYDAGAVSWYTTTDTGDAKAVRMSLPEGTDSSKVAYALIRSYQDLDNFSATMKFHIWEDNAGVPGADMIDPFDFESDCTPTNTSAMTRVDLRGYDLTVYGDFWVGFSAKDGIVYTTGEVMSGDYDELGDFPYQRSFDGAASGTSWAWSLVSGTNYHIRAVVGDFVAPDGIEDSYTPSITTLEQNYPNPFNPATTINFSLAKDSKVSLVVYDVMGREVANLMNKNMVSGSHTVTFDASRLVSGVYYYTLRAGETSQTKKMMLIK